MFFRSIISSFPKSFSLLAFAILYHVVFAQDYLDSLEHVVSTTKDPVERYTTQIRIGSFYYHDHEYDSSVTAYTKALEMIPKDSAHVKGKVLNYIAWTYHEAEDLEKAIAYFKADYRFYLHNNAEPEIIADILKDLGRTFYEMASYDSAMVYYKKSQKIFEENNLMNEDYGHLLHFIGSVFKRQDDDETACEYYQKQIDFGKRYDMPVISAEGFYLSSLCIEGDTAHVRHNLKAMQNYIDLGNEHMAALMASNVAGRYQNLEMYDSAYYYEKIYLDYLQKEDGGKSELASAMASIGSILTDMGRYREAEKYLIQAEEYAFQSTKKQMIRLKSIYYGLYKVNKYSGNYKDAVYYQYLYYTYRDSARDAEHKDAILEMEVAYETEKKEAEIAMLQKDNQLKEKEKEVARAEAEKESFTKKLYMSGGLIMLLLGGFVLVKWRESIKQKKVIEYQKMLVEEKNRDIMDSMLYASSIQKAIITSEEYFSRMFNEFFVLYKPRDIVSGDFYWAYEAPDGARLFAVGDCTGHGVPGAMMSMLGTAFLNEIVIEGKECDPKSILDKMRESVINAMKQGNLRDGMDMSFCLIKDKKLVFSGANLPIYVLRNGDLTELKGDKQPVGYQPMEKIPFSNNEFDLQEGDKIYLFSDGYADQFGGPKGKKYKYKTLRDKLIELWGMSLKEQKNIMDSEFESWKGEMEQVDDVCVIGVRI